MNKIINLAKILNDFFNTKADILSREVGFIKRRRKLNVSVQR